MPGTRRDRYVSTIVTEMELLTWIEGRDVLATLDLTAARSGGELAAFIAHWRSRWLAGERVRVLVALDGGHAVALADPDAPEPTPGVSGNQQQLTL